MRICVKSQTVRVSSSSSSPQTGRASGLIRRVAAIGVKPVLLVVGWVTAALRSRRAGGGAQAKAGAPKLDRREEKRRRKELVRTAKTAGRRRAA